MDRWGLHNSYRDVWNGVVTRLQAFLIILLIWAGVYLPGLGTTEIKGEEGRRILPAIAMLDDGHWIVPYIGGEPYLNKPPFLNWAIAGMFEVTGIRNGWTARLPTVFAILALAGVTVLGGSHWLRPEGALIAAVVMLTNFAMVDKGRLAEIEGLYVSLSGIAIILWLARYQSTRYAAGDWFLWLPAMIFLGLATLTKGPLHLLFFYAIVLSVLIQEGKISRLFTVAHLVGVLLMAGIVALWMVPYLKMSGDGEASATWSEQFIGRVTGGNFDFGRWIVTIPRALSDYLPWVVFAPLMWASQDSLQNASGAAKIFRGIRFALVPCFFGLLVIPGILPRYVLPLIVPFALALAFSLRDLPPGFRAMNAWRKTINFLIALAAMAALAIPFMAGFSALNVIVSALLIGITFLLRYVPTTSAVLLTIRTGVFMGMIMAIYAVAAVPRIVAEDDIRPTGAAINDAIGDSPALYVQQGDLFPALVYVRFPVRYFEDFDEIPTEAQRVLLRKKKIEKLRKVWPEARVITEVSSKYKKDYVIVSPGSPE